MLLATLLITARSSPSQIINTYGAPALKAVGFEGIFGFLILGILLVPLYYIQVSGGAHDYPIEDAVDAMKQVANSR